MKIALAALLLLAVSPAAAQQRQYYDAMGRTIGRSTTDTQGTTTFYDAMGRTTARSSTSGNTTTTYNPRGQVIERNTRSK
jgi:YD repeat-containing protein